LSGHIFSLEEIIYHQARLSVTKHLRTSKHPHASFQILPVKGQAQNTKSSDKVRIQLKIP